jgi:signal transduction histidine kinase
LAQRAGELAEADRHKDEFLAMLAHELRNPLNGLSMVLDLMRQRGIEDPRQARSLDSARREVQRIVDLVKELSDLSQIGRDKVLLRPRRLDLVQLVREVTEDRRGLLEAAGLRLTVELHGGRVRAHSEAIGCGSEFTVLLPVSG